MANSTAVPSNAKKALLYAAIAVLCWSFGAYFCCLLAKVPVLQVLAMAQIAGALSIMLFKRKIPSGRKLMIRLRDGWPFVCLLICNQISYVYAFRSAPAAHVDLINYTWPVLLIIGESLRTKTRLTPHQVLGIAVCFSGLMVLFFPKLLETSTQACYLPGYLAALSAALSWTLYSVLRRCRSSSGSTEQSIGNDILLSGITLAILHTLTGTWTLPQTSDCLVISAFAILCYGLAFPFWRRSLQFGHYNLTGGIANAIPILSIAWLIVGGIVSLSHTLWLATVLVSFGCYLLSFRHVKTQLEPTSFTTPLTIDKKVPATAALEAGSA